MTAPLSNPGSAEDSVNHALHLARLMETALGGLTARGTTKQDLQDLGIGLAVLVDYLGFALEALQPSPKGN